jgi:hypothetical protein
MNYQGADEKLGSRESRKLDNNTYLKRRGDNIAVLLHETDIVTMKPDGVNVLNSGGWKTVTTKDRINKFSDVCITQRKGVWYINGTNNLFYDGIETKDGQVVSKIVTEDKKQDKLMKQINAYCEKVKKMKTIPMPSAGDCWYCHLREDKTGKPLGEVSNSDHLPTHLKEKYVHGSLIYNALESAGYNAGFIMQICNDKGMGDSWRPNIVRAVKKYFKRQLGLVA